MRGLLLLLAATMLASALCEDKAAAMSLADLATYASSEAARTPQNGEVKDGPEYQENGMTCQDWKMPGAQPASGAQTFCWDPGAADALGLLGGLFSAAPAAAPATLATVAGLLCALYAPPR